MVFAVANGRFDHNYGNDMCMLFLHSRITWCQYTTSLVLHCGIWTHQYSFSWNRMLFEVLVMRLMKVTNLRAYKQETKPCDSCRSDICPLGGMVERMSQASGSNVVDCTSTEKLKWYLHMYLAKMGSSFGMIEWSSFNSTFLMLKFCLGNHSLWCTHSLTETVLSAEATRQTSLDLQGLPPLPLPELLQLGIPVLLRVWVAGKVSNRLQPEGVQCFWELYSYTVIH